MKKFWFWKRENDDTPSPASPDPDESGLWTGDAAADVRSLEILLETIAAVSSNIDLESVLRDVVDRSLQVTKAERAILLLGDGPDSLVVRMAQDRDGRALTGTLQWSRSLVRRCLEEGSAVRSVVQSDREALEVGQSVYDLKLRAVMCAPMVTKDRTVGVIYVDSRAQRREFSSRDFGLFGAISAQLAIAIENARLHADSLEKVKLEKDIEIARRIQQHLLPPVPQAEGLEFGLRYVAAEQASGDTYDFVPMPDGRFAVMIGDVTGHGVGAALLTHAVQAALRSYLELLGDAGDIVTRLNRRLVRSVETGNFMSLLLVFLDARNGTLQYVNAGHPGLLHCTADGVREYDRTGMVLGVVDDQIYEPGPMIRLAPGDLLFLRTDGIDEARSHDREVFGLERLREVLGGACSDGAAAAVEAVEAAVRSFTGGAAAEDDSTMIAVKLTS